MFLGGAGREEVIDRYIGRRDQHRLSMRQRTEAICPVVVSHAGRRTAAEGQFADEAIDRLLLAAENEGRQRITDGPTHASTHKRIGYL